MVVFSSYFWVVWLIPLKNVTLIFDYKSNKESSDTIRANQVLNLNPYDVDEQGFTCDTLRIE
jgi:fibrillarin-like rRNA methylase